MAAPRFVKEFRRRHVFRVAVVYAIVAWGLLQFADIAFDALALPEWSITLLLVVLGLGFPLALVLAWAFDLTPQGVVRTDTVQGEAEPKAGAAAGATDGLVVLPFSNLSADADNEYFSDGVTEDLIWRLCSIGSLRVISRTSAWQYKDRRVGARQIATELGVAYLVEGSVRRSNGQVRISAQLIDAGLDRPLWSETYDRELEDIFAIQSDVASRIATALQRTLSGPEEAGNGGTGEGARSARSARSVGGAGTSDLAAYDDYLRGRFHWNRRSATDLDLSVQHFQRAVERDPDFVAARAGLAEAYVTQAVYGIRPAGEALPLARREAEEALRRDPGQASARSALACVKAVHEWDWDAARALFQHVVRDHPQYPTAPQWYAMNVLTPLGRFDEAVAQLEAARAVDPLSRSIEASFGVVDFMRRDHESAERRFTDLIERQSDFTFGHYYRGLNFLPLDRAEEAVAALHRARDTGGWSAEITAGLGMALAAAGRAGEARDVLARLTGAEPDRYVSPVKIAQLQAALGEVEPALDSLEAGLEAHAADVIWIDVSPVFDALRARPRFQAVRDHVFGEAATHE